MNLTLAAGSQDRWNTTNRSRFKIKQLIEIDGETLIERIQQQFGGWVITNCPEIIKVSKCVYKPLNHKWTVETLLSTHELWHGQVIVTLGDVYYTDNAVKTIKKYRGKIRFFGDLNEIFAISFNDFNRVELCLYKCMYALAQIPYYYDTNGKLNQLYRRYHRYDTNVARIDKHFTMIKDKTQDFDCANDLKQFYEKNRI